MILNRCCQDSTIVALESGEPYMFVGDYNLYRFIARHNFPGGSLGSMTRLDLESNSTRSSSLPRALLRREL